MCYFLEKMMSENGYYMQGGTEYAYYHYLTLLDPFLELLAAPK